ECAGNVVGRCALYKGGPVRACTCGSDNDCPALHACASGLCTYNLACAIDGGTILVDPVAARPNDILPYIDGVEDYRDAGNGKPRTPELRPSGPSPLAAAIRSATAWFTSAKTLDSEVPCRPYALVLLTNGADTCGSSEANPQAGALAAVRGFVAATA